MTHSDFVKKEVGRASKQNGTLERKGKKMGNITTAGQNNQTAEIRRGVKMEEVEPMLRSLTDLLTTPSAMQGDRDQIAMTTDFLSRPAPRDWIQGEVAKTLIHYFVGQVPPNFAKSIGADYDAELAEFPAWAIVKARRWWLSSDNEYRHRKPLPGDLSERCRDQMALVNAARQRIELFDRTGSPHYSFEKRETPAPTVQLTDAERAQRSEELRQLASTFGDRMKQQAPQTDAQKQDYINAEKNEPDM